MSLFRPLLLMICTVSVCIASDYPKIVPNEKGQVCVKMPSGELSPITSNEAFHVKLPGKKDLSITVLESKDGRRLIIASIKGGSFETMGYEVILSPGGNFEATSREGDNIAIKWTKAVIIQKDPNPPNAELTSLLQLPQDDSIAPQPIEDIKITEHSPVPTNSAAPQTQTPSSAISSATAGYSQPVIVTPPEVVIINKPTTSTVPVQSPLNQQILPFPPEPTPLPLPPPKPLAINSDIFPVYGNGTVAPTFILVDNGILRTLPLPQSDGYAGLSQYGVKIENLDQVIIRRGGNTFQAAHDEKFKDGDIWTTYSHSKSKK